MHIPNIDRLQTRFFTSLIWGHIGRDGIDVRVDFTTNWEDSVSTHVIKYAQSKYKNLAYCSSAMDARDKVKNTLREILRKEGIQVETVVLTGSDRIMMKGWLVNLLSGKICSNKSDVAIVVGTSALNCGISSLSLYYICCK